MCFGAGLNLHAQNYAKMITIKGKVKSLADTAFGDTTGLADALIYISDAPNEEQFLTDSTGNFSFSVEKKDRPSSIWINYKNLYQVEKNIPFADSVEIYVINDTLPILPETQAIDYGSEVLEFQKPFVNYTVGEEAVTNHLSSNFMSSLQGRAAGLHQVSTSGAIGSAQYSYIRGINSMNLSTPTAHYSGWHPGSFW